MEERYIGAAVACLLPVIEKATLLAGEYTKKSGRTVLTAKDMEYAMKYCARFKVGEKFQNSGVWDSESGEEEDEDDIVTVEEQEDPFIRYSGDDILMNSINESYDTWEQWEPTNPVEHMLKDAIDKNMYSD